MNHQQGFVIGVGSRWTPIEGSCDHCFVVDHGELVMQLVSAGEAGGQSLVVAVVYGSGASPLFLYLLPIRSLQDEHQEKLVPQ